MTHTPTSSDYESQGDNQEACSENDENNDYGWDNSESERSIEYTHDTTNKEFESDEGDDIEYVHRQSNISAYNTIPNNRTPNNHPMPNSFLHNIDEYAKLPKSPVSNKLG